MKQGLKRYCIVIAAAAFILTMAGAAKAMELQWFGQSAFKITTPGGKVIVIDPFITNNPKTPKDLKDLSKLGKVDLILITHGHGDHMGDLAELARMTGARVALNADMGLTIASLGWVEPKKMIRFNKGGPIKPFGGKLTITMVRAEHSSEVRYMDPDTGKTTMEPGGEPAGYIIEMEDGYKVYHAGDTDVFADMKYIAEYYKPDIALLPIGGHFTMDPAHAAYAIKTLLKTKTVVPMHYGTFPPLKGTPQQLKAALGDFPVNIVVMKPGESRKF